MSNAAKLASRGPYLDIGAGVTIDCRFVDRVELVERFVDPHGMRVLITLESVDVALEFSGTRAEAEDLIVGLAPYTRAAPLTSDGDYADAESLRDSIFDGTYATPPVVVVKGEAAEVGDGLVSAGAHRLAHQTMCSQRPSVVRDLVLTDGARAPAAVFALAIAAAEPPNLAMLDDRLREFRDSRRQRNPS